MSSCRSAWLEVSRLSEGCSWALVGSKLTAVSGSRIRGYATNKVAADYSSLIPACVTNP